MVVAGLPVKREFVETLPGFLILLRVVNRHSELRVVMVHAVKSFLPAQIFAMRTARVIEPASWIQPDRLDHKRVVVHPFSDGVPIPARVRILGEFSSIRTDGAPITKILI